MLIIVFTQASLQITSVFQHSLFCADTIGYTKLAFVLLYFGLEALCMAHYLNCFAAQTYLEFQEVWLLQRVWCGLLISVI